MLSKPLTYVKAIWTFVTVLLGQMVLVVVDDMSFSDVSTAKWLVISANTLIITGGVYGWQNQPVIQKGQ